MANINYNQPEYVSKRPRYFDGQFLSVKDFVDEQQYHIDRQRRISRFLHVSGIVDGLEVTAIENAVLVTPGTAIDALGRQLLLPKPPDTDTYRVERPAEPGNYQLIIEYHEEETDLQEEGSESNTRFHEIPQLRFIPSSAEKPDTAIVLAVIQEGNLSANSNVRQYSGLHLPNGSEEGVTFRAEDNQQRAVLSGSLKVTDKIEAQNLSVAERLVVGTLDPTAALEVDREGDKSIDFIVNGRLLSVSEEGGLWISQKRFVGGVDNDKIGFYNNERWRLLVNDEGQVGIGTNTPTANLHVSSKNSAELIIEADTENSDEGNHPVITLKQDGGGMVGNLGYFDKKNDLILKNKDNKSNKVAQLSLTGDGDIKLGKESTSFSSIFFGYIRNNGVIISGNGFTSSKTSEGIYNITFEKELRREKTIILATCEETGMVVSPHFDQGKTWALFVYDINTDAKNKYIAGSSNLYFLAIELS